MKKFRIISNNVSGYSFTINREGDFFVESEAGEQITFPHELFKDMLEAYDIIMRSRYVRDNDEED